MDPTILVDYSAVGVTGVVQIVEEHPGADRLESVFAELPSELLPAEVIDGLTVY